MSSQPPSRSTLYKQMSFLPRSAFLFVNGKLSWSHFHLMISRSTTPDLIKIISKLDEFFTQQVMSSRRVFQPTTTFPPTAPSKVQRKISESGRTFVLITSC